ncbi:hypothetical protein SAMN05216226_10462 [Halovenus aranensis]|uniref:Uncharacterized protein n=1 Tax=Halovenus aranensis TaxID=890420 RepID=A0A1G8U5H6_9EURY|nr:DUF5820 family protein [Halovenus aranensis]SDJ48969.1 hypothetical protein SAMN05216226_10462 [Halovenus aranensis]
MEFEGLDDAWEVWSLESTKAVLAYRPDVFDSQEFPPECLPTIYVTKGRRGRRPGRDVPDPEDPWYITLYLEPEVNLDERAFESQGAATAGAMDLADEFSRGEVSYRDLYQVPRQTYFERLDELTGR